MGEAAVGLQTSRTLGSVIKEKDDELALFLEMRRREREGDGGLAVDFDPPPGPNPAGSPVFSLVPTAPTRKATSDDFLNDDFDKNDYDWLLTPPGTPLIPYLEQESIPTGHLVGPVARAALVKSRLANSHDALSKGNPQTKQMPLSCPTTSSVGTRRPLSSGGPASVLNKPSAAPRMVSSKSSGGTVSVPSKSSNRPAASTCRPTVPVISKSSRSTPTTRTMLPVKSTGPPRETTPSRSSTPTSRNPVASAIKSLSRGPSPPRRSSVLANHSNASPPSQLLATKTNAVVSNTSLPAHASSSAVKTLTDRPSEPHNFSNGSTLMSTAVPIRPNSTSRGRTGSASSRSLSAEPAHVNKIRRQSRSPSRGRAANGSMQNGISVPVILRANGNVSDDVNPVLIGTKMVERVINARRLPPPKQDSLRSSYGNASLKTASDSSGFGRTLSKKSLDMALRHMEIRQCSN